MSQQLVLAFAHRSCETQMHGMPTCFERSVDGDLLTCSWRAGLGRRLEPFLTVLPGSLQDVSVKAIREQDFSVRITQIGRIN